MDRRLLFVWYRLVVASWKTFGLAQTINALFFLPALACSRFFLFLDRCFFPAYRRVPVVRPVFIIGHPRSGTTFLHRLITQTGEFPSFTLRQLGAPSLTARVLLRPLVKPMARISARRYRSGTIYPSGSHRITLDSVEEEELLFFHWADTAFLNKTAIAFDDRNNKELLRYDDQPAAYRRRSVRRFRECLQRQIYWTGKTQVVAKMPFSTMRIKTLMEEFPDALFVYMVRSPFDTIPSHLSQHRAYFDNRWGLEDIPADKLRRYFERRYQANVDIYRYFHDLRTRGELPPGRVMELKYDRLLTDLEGVFNQFVEFTGVQVSDELRRKVREQAAKQKDYKAEHTNLDLAAFGLTRERILQDLGFVFDEYGFDRELQKAS